MVLFFFLLVQIYLFYEYNKMQIKMCKSVMNAFLISESYNVIYKCDIFGEKHFLVKMF